MPHAVYCLIPSVYLPHLPTPASPPQGFLPKALLLGVGQTIGYCVFSEALGFYSRALGEAR